jgi:hypothetical protein
MNPATKENMRRQLTLWGYPNNLVERLNSWKLIRCYNLERKKRLHSDAIDIAFDLAAFERQLVSDSSSVKLVRRRKKFRSAVLKKKVALT